MQFLLLAPELLGSFPHRPKAGEIKLKKDGFFPCLLFEFTYGCIRSGFATRRHVYLGIMLEKSLDCLSTNARIAARHDHDLTSEIGHLLSSELRLWWKTLSIDSWNVLQYRQ